MNEAGTRVLVSAGSKYGSTAEIADRIAVVLREHRFDVEVVVPEQVADVSLYEAVVLGSAVYAGRWVKDARELADRLAVSSPGAATWLFSSGPIGDPPKPEEDPVDVAEIMKATSARDHRVFAGKIDKSKLNFGEKAIVMAFRAPEGDYRDWSAIDSWANEIATSLVREVSER